MSPQRIRWFLLALMGLVLIVYSPVVNGYFLSDDFGIWEIARRGLAHIWSHPSDRWFRPMGLSTWWFSLQIFGNVAGLHLASNVVWHILNCYLVFHLCSYFPQSADPRRALTATAIFAVFPLHSEVVAWLSCRYELGCATFMLAACIFYLRGLDQGQRVLHGLAICSFMVAILFKEMALSLPLILLILTYARPHPPKFAYGRILLVSLVILSAYAAIRWSALGSLGSYPEQLIFGPKMFHILSDPWAALLYPVNRSVVHSGPPWIRIAISAGLTVSYVLFLYRARKVSWKRHGLLLAVLVASLVPLVNISQVDASLQSSRYYYIPSIVFSMWLAIMIVPDSNQSVLHQKRGLHHLYRRPGFAISIYLATLCGLQFIHNPLWQNAGHQARAILSKLAPLPPGPKHLTHIPDNIHGAYVFRNALSQAHTLVNNRNEPLCWNTDSVGAPLVGRCHAAARTYLWNGVDFVATHSKSRTRVDD